MKEFKVEDEVQSATHYLKNISNIGEKSSLYDTLSVFIHDVLTERPNDSADLIEDYLKKQSTDKLKDENSSLLDAAINQIKLFEKPSENDLLEGVETEEVEIPLPNCSQLGFFFEQAGVGVGREEIYRIFLSLKQLVFNHPLSSVRFWGKIFGIEANYIVAEVEYREGEEEETSEAENEDVLEEKISNEEENKEPREDDDLPKPNWKPPPEIPKEDHHTGANKKVYFVCNQPGDTWVKLPHVTPKEITLARSITKFFTGKLDAEIQSYPPFPYKEAKYLRAQIARISASTQISPAGFYMFDEDEEEDEEARENYIQNTEFEGLSLRELTDPTMCKWVHHTQYILPQGRCTWFNPNEKPEDDFEEEDFDEKETENENNENIAETGPQLLTSVQHDKGIAFTPAWSTYTSSRILPEYAVAVARSNRWPGAYAFAKGKMFENIYIGWGDKYSHLCYTPPSPPTALNEFPENEEIKEVDDPSVEEERALKEKQEEALKASEDTVDLDDDDDDDDD